MKKRLLAIVLCVITVLCAIPFTAAADTTNVIEDEKLLECLIDRGYDTSGDGAVSADEISKAVMLLIDNEEISSLEGLQYATSLRVLDASNNNISDISPIKNLGLMALDLTENNISGSIDFADTNWSLLMNLSIGYNELTGVSNITDLLSVTYIDLSCNKLSDITEILGLTNLESLYIQNNCYSLNPSDSDLAYFAQIKAANPSMTTFVYAPQLVGEITEDFVLDITDTNLLAALIANGVDVTGDGKISACELGSIYKKLDLSGYGITDISALAYAINTPSIDLSSNAITSVDALAGLTQLTELNISYNDIEDIAPLSALTALTSLYASANRIEDISAVASLDSLVNADLSHNNIKDISALSSLTNLKVLNLSDNFISSAQFASSFDNLDLSYNIFTSVSQLVSISATKLDITYNNLVASDISASKFTQVTTLVYSEQMEYDGSYRDAVEIPDAELLSILLAQPKINTNGDDIITKGELANYSGMLNLSGTGVTDLTGLRYMKKLSIFRINNTAVSDISEMSGMTRLEIFTAGNSQISSIAPVLELEKLETLSLPNTKVSNLDELNNNKLYSLISINFTGNGITDVSPLKNIPTLKIISLTSNGISDISFISSITAPENVYLNDNEIKNIDVIYDLTTLKKLDVSFNWIDIPADFEETMYENNQNLTYLVYDNQKKIIMADIVIKSPGGNFFSLEINGEQQEDQDDYSDTLVAGTVFNIVAIEETGEFLYWKLDDGKIVSYEKEYSFVAASSTHLTAVFKRSYTNMNYVSFLTSSDQEISRRLYSVNTTADRIEIARSPQKTGHVFMGWSIDGETAIAAENLATEIVAALQNGDVTLTPVYAKLDTLFTITVTNGTGGGQYTASSSVTVTADAPAEGKRFAYWVDGDGKIMSYKESYLFMVSSDISLTAVYVDADEELEAVAVITINDVTANYDANTISFVVARDIPEEYSVVQTGILLTTDISIAEDESAFVIGAQGIIKGTSSSTSNKATYVATKGNVQVGDTWYARGYVVYLDANDELVYLYSAIESYTM